MAKSLPMGLNRISWKPAGLPSINPAIKVALPMGLNRISWKRFRCVVHVFLPKKSLPMGLNRISWKHFISLVSEKGVNSYALPMGLNRISWKQKAAGYLFLIQIVPTDGFKSD